MGEWGFLSNHGRVLLCVARDPSIRLRDIAATLDITERSAFGIVADLVDGGFVVKERDGRRNRYVVQRECAFPDPAASRHSVGEVLDVLGGASGDQPRSGTRS